jgi:hypothetical protein
VTFANETASGWQQASFATALAITANTVYIASYHTDTGNYALTEPGFASEVDSAPLHAPADQAGAGNGVYAYGASTFPNQTWDASNYWVDAVFDTVAARDSTPPTTSLTAPAANSTVSGTIALSATASDNVGVAGVQFSIDGVALGAQDTTSPYAASWDTTTVANGSHSVMAVARDTSGNTASAAVTVTVSNATGPACPCSVWTLSTIPAMMATDPNAAELGVKVQSDVNGYVAGLRFYKYAQNSGTHTGHLWSATGTLLGTVTFTSETASGWQQANFTTKIPITANTTYVVSYHTDTGNYALTEPGLTASVNTGPLHVLANASAGGNGVYAYGSSAFPAQTWDASNYWVDLVFTTTP